MVLPHEELNDIALLLETLPDHIRHTIAELPFSHDDLLEIILDLGRRPEARYRAHEAFLGEMTVTEHDIDHIIRRIGTFGEDNRAGIERTLHRISAIRNRNQAVIGLTCRIGRALYGTVSIIRDIIETGQSILILGRPGTGKTTLLRETARVLAEDLRKRVVVVDTSNEIAGDGDIPHPGIGRARRMQVPRPSEQHAVMIEAVENHMPEVIIIDEIGTEREALAARTIAERGVQLVGTAHGNTLDNLMINPTLSDLIGGIQAVTLGDDEARRRGTQKTVLERKAPPTFDVLIEIQNWDRVIVYPNIAEAVDDLLFGVAPQPELRFRNEQGDVSITTAPPSDANESPFVQRRTPRTPFQDQRTSTRRTSTRPNTPYNHATLPSYDASASQQNGLNPSTHRIFPFGVNRNRLEHAIDRLRVPAVIVRDLQDATLVITLKNYYRRSAQRIRQAEDHGVPVYVIRNNTVMQMERQLAIIFQIPMDDDDVSDEDPPPRIDAALLEAETAITQVINGEQTNVELHPQNSYIRRLQHLMAERYNLRSESSGIDPDRRVRIYR